MLLIFNLIDIYKWFHLSTHVFYCPIYGTAPCDLIVEVKCGTAFSHFWHYGADKENLFNNQELLKLVIISFILMTFMWDSGGMV